MSYLLFLDESGHDHRTAPYEVRGGVALHASKLWPFIRAMQDREQSIFGGLLHHYGAEIKGSRLLDKRRFKWAAQEEPLDEATRRQHSLAFLNKGLEGRSPTRIEFTAFGQASIMMAKGILALLKDFDAVLFAAAIPDVSRPTTYQATEYLRKDHVFLLERYFYFLESKKEHGLLVMDETEKIEDRRFVRRLESYFTKTEVGLSRTGWIVPVPFFVSSDMTSAVQAADVCIYGVNWAFRLPKAGMNAPTRPEIERELLPLLRQLRFQGEGYRDGNVFQTHGIVYVPDPYGER